MNARPPLAPREKAERALTRLFKEINRAVRPSESLAHHRMVRALSMAHSRAVAEWEDAEAAK